MSRMKWMALVAVVLTVGLTAGCGDSDDSSSSGGGSSSSGSYAGVYTGQACGRPMTVSLSQNGTSLSGSYTLSNPTFTDSFSGTLSTTEGSATVRMNSTGRNWWMDLSFSGYNSFVGGFYKEGSQVCSVSGNK